MRSSNDCPALNVRAAAPPGTVMLNVRSDQVALVKLWTLLLDPTCTPFLSNCTYIDRAVFPPPEPPRRVRNTTLTVDPPVSTSCFCKAGLRVHVWLEFSLIVIVPPDTCGTRVMSLLVCRYSTLVPDWGTCDCDTMIGCATSSGSSPAGLLTLAVLLICVPAVTPAPIATSKTIVT